MARGVVVVYFSRLGGRLRGDQKIMLDADAQLIAKLKGYDFRGHYEAAHDYSASIFFVPDDVLVREEASVLGIRGPNDVYGGVAPHPFVKTKAITHQLIDSDAQRPQGWSAAFAEKVRDVTLAGYTVFNAEDARLAAQRMLHRGPVRLKQPLGASGRGQTLVTTLDQLERFLQQFDADEMATYGLVLEENLREVTTLSVGHIAVDSLIMTYYGTQRRVQDNDGRAIYGGSGLVCVRGGWEALEALALTPESRAAVAQAKLYASWRAGGASSAELAALAAFAQNPALQIVEASAVEEFGRDHEAPADAIIHFAGEDPQLGPLLRYTVVKRKSSTG